MIQPILVPSVDTVDDRPGRFSAGEALFVDLAMGPASLLGVEQRIGRATQTRARRTRVLPGIAWLGHDAGLPCSSPDVAPRAQGPPIADVDGELELNPTDSGPSEAAAALSRCTTVSQRNGSLCLVKIRHGWGRPGRVSARAVLGG